MTKPFKTVLIGFGKIAAGYAKDSASAKIFPYSTHIQVLQDHNSFQLVAVVDPDEKARKLSRQWGVSAYEKIEEIENLDSVEVVVLATPPNVRQGIVTRFKNIKALMLEKPVAIDWPQAKSFAMEIANLNIKTQVNFLRRADRTTRDLVFGKLLEEIGEIQAVNLVYGNGLKNNGSHMIDLARMFLGEIQSVQALSLCPSTVESPIQNDINLPFLMRFKTGCLVTANPLSFKHYRENAIQFWGTKGRLEYGHGGFTILKAGLTSNRMNSKEFELTLENLLQIPSTIGTALFDMYSNLAGALNGTQPLWSPLDSALANQAVIDSICQSMKNGGASIYLKEDG